jgi:predicted amidophosphoribosyltransferase
MPTMTCAACGAKQKHNTIRCERCGKPFVFADKFDEQAQHALDSITLTQKIRRMLAGMPPEAQGAILADLLAIWLAGHVDLDGDSDGLIELILQAHLEAVRKLVPVNFKLYVEPQLKERRH